MKISRRSFIKWCTASAAALGLTQVDLKKLENVVLAAETTPPVIWLQGSGCSGCSISLMNAIEETTIDNFLINQVSMKYHQDIMVAAGDLAHSCIDQTVAQYDGQFILVIEGGVPIGGNGNYCVLGEKNGQPWTMLSAVQELAPRAKYVVAAGTCAAFGGVPKVGPNPTNVQRLDTNIINGMTTNRVINLPGCPVHPYTFVKTIIDLWLMGMPGLDSEGCPTAYYKSSVHSACPRRGTGSAAVLGELNKCYKNLGCDGPQTNNNCPTRKWNNKVNWCVDGGHHCISCSSKEFLSDAIYKF